MGLLGLFFFRRYEGEAGLKFEVFFGKEERVFALKRDFTSDVISISFKLGLKDKVCTVLTFNL